MSSGRLVSPTTKTLPASTTPSILARSWLTTESRTPVVSPLSAPALPRDRVHLVQDDHVELRRVARRRPLRLRRREELAHLLLRLAHKLVDDLGAVDDLRLARAERARELAREERLAAARRAGEQDAAQVRAPKAPRRRRVGARREHAPHDRLELRLEAADVARERRASARASALRGGVGTPPASAVADRTARRRRRRRRAPRRRQRRRGGAARASASGGSSGGIAASVLDGWVSWLEDQFEHRRRRRARAVSVARPAELEVRVGRRAAAERARRLGALASEQLAEHLAVGPQLPRRRPSRAAA